MANAAGFIQESIWRDDHWRNLSRSAQALYMQLLSQKELDCAGVLPLQPNKWAKGCNGLSVQQVWDDLDELQRERFVFYDVDTDEVFIRTYVRNSNVLKVPNVRKSARRSALLVGSETIRPILAAELRATGHPEFIATAEEIHPHPNPSGNPSERVTQTLSEGFAKPTGVGTGMGTGLTLVTTYFGEEPAEFCANHPNGTDKACRPCAQARESYPRRLAEWKGSQAAERQRVIDNCHRCDDRGLIEISDNTQTRCNHETQGVTTA